ncbi:condensation domain-containing protein [Sphaerisporangium sp. NBC_01403]|uniref:condensation domain-containing protein n=1 Tax=Sphaerisporangium sp. NBC_01403 TaxID=2903599 RepID=UPI00324C58CF
MSDEELRGRVAGLPSHRQELVARLLAARRRPAGDAIPAVPRDSGLLECSPEQRRLWLAAQTDRQVAAPNVTLGVGLSGPLDLGALAKALTGLTERHEALRTVFVNSGGEPRQMILGSADAPLTVVDLTGDPAAEETARRLAVAAGGERFDLASGPLLRLTVYRTGPEEHRLLFVCDHLVCDGGSLGVVARDLAGLYSGRALPAPPAVTYADYAAWARARARAHAGERLDHWRERLADPPPLLGGEQGAASPRRPGGRLSATTTIQVEGGLMDALRGGSATPFVTVLAAFSVLLHRVTGSSGLTVGTVSGTRARRELEHLVGCFINMVPIPLRVDGTEGFRTVVARTRDEVGTALANEVPFDTLVSGLGGRRRPGVHPIFQVALIQQDAPAPPGGWDGLRAFEWSEEVDGSAYDLTLTMIPRGTGYELVLTHRVDRVPQEVADALGPAFEALLDALSISPDVPVGELAVPSLESFPRRPAASPAAAPAAPEPPGGDPVDERLAAEVSRIWSEVLKKPDIEEDADLFDLGGDSLAITHIAARVQESLGVEVPAWMFFEAPTVGGFVRALTALGKRPDFGD